MAGITSLNMIRTMEDYVSYGNNLDISNSKLFLKTSIGDKDKIIVNVDFILDKYLDLIEKKYVEAYTFSDEEMTDYKYAPKKFCYDIYGNQELWASLLRINNMKSVMDFNKKDIKIFKESFLSIIQEIMNLEDGAIKENKNSL